MGASIVVPLKVAAEVVPQFWALDRVPPFGGSKGRATIRTARYGYELLSRVVGMTPVTCGLLQLPVRR